MLKQIFRLFRTLRHLKCEQLYYQLYYRICAKMGGQQPASVDLMEVDRAVWPEGLQLPLPCNVDAYDRDHLRFRFVNLEHSFGNELDWSGGPHGKLWDYNLHYFEWLWGLEPEVAKQVVSDWVEKHPYAKSAVGWEPYPLSLRITNWIGYWGTKGRAFLDADEDFCKVLFQSLGLQCDWLTKRLEKHILGNHYLENSVALWLAGSFFTGDAADQWLSVGDAILAEQLNEQILGDGMHFELSPMYHNRILWLLSWLSAIDEKRFAGYYQRVQSVSALLQHPDGRIALLNDSAFGIYPEVIAEVPYGAFALEAAGYYGMRSKSEDYLICDAGRIGPDYIPGHAHCDVGSFELSIGGERFITDTGVFQYIDSERRFRSRATGAHNVLAPGNLEQAEIWSAFRVGNRPNVSVDKWQSHDVGFDLELSHDGFRRSGISASRGISFDASSCLLSITDTVDSSVKTRMLGHLHFAPEVKVLSCEDKSVCLDHHGKRVSIHFENVDRVSMGQSEYYPEFNTCLMRPSLEYEICESSGVVAIRIEWSI